MDEFDFIARLRPLAGPGGLGLLDDAARLDVPDGFDLVMSTDTMVEGVHFPEGRIGGGFSERLLRTSLSDLAAKGARPIGYSLNVTWPKNRHSRWIDGFIQGLHDAQAAFDCPLLGGDTTSALGPLVASATVYGVVPEGGMVTRSGARPGDVLWHTGVLGRAEKGLDFLRGRPPMIDPDERLACEEAYLRPEPRFSFRKALRAHATACADISDGLVSEAGHIATASGVRVSVDAAVAAGARFGDDYELLFTAPVEATDALREAAAAIGLPITACGSVAEGEGVWVTDAPARPSGFRHTL